MLLIILVTILFIFLFLVFYSRNYQREFISKCNPKEHPLRPLYNTIAYLRSICLRKQENLEKEARMLAYKKGATVFFCLLVTIVLASICELQLLRNQEEIQANRIARPYPGEGEKSITATYQTEYGKGIIDFVVEEKILTGAQRTELFDYGEKILNQLILGDNTSLEKVTKPLCLVHDIPGTGLKVNYKIHDYDLISSNGSIDFEHVQKEGSKAVITAQITYENSQRTVEYDLMIYPPNLTNQEQLEKELSLAIQQEDMASRTQDYQRLPEKIDQYDVIWHSSRKGKTVLIVFFGIIITALMPVMIERRKRDKEQKIVRQMKRDYTEIVIKYQLLLSAGMTTRGAWSRIVTDYSASKERLIRESDKGIRRKRQASKANQKKKERSKRVA